MCEAKPSSNGGRKMTPSGVTYYDNTPQGQAAAAADMNKSMGSGNEEGHHAPPAPQPPTDLADCTTYTDTQWDTGCSKFYRFSHMGRKPEGGQIPPGHVACNWQKLCQNILDKVKEQFPGLIISSGFRPGTGGSDHGFGRAADIQVLSGDKIANAKEVFKFIGKSGMPFSQLLYEGTWVHVAYGGGSTASSAIGVARNGVTFTQWTTRTGPGLPPDLAWA